MDLRYSAEEEAFRAELVEWLDEVLPTVGPPPDRSSAPHDKLREAIGTAWLACAPQVRLLAQPERIDELITPAIKQRFDRRIRIRGYMFPTLRESGLKQFVLVRDNLECCFGPGAALYDCVLVYLSDGATANYSVRPVTVEGHFRFEKMQAGPQEPLLAIYRLDDARVE